MPDTDRTPVDYRHARDIPDDVFLRAVIAAGGTGEFAWSNRDAVSAALGGPDCAYTDRGDPAGVPGKVVLAKANRLLNRRLIDGCGCGCRGDWFVTPAGYAFLADLGGAAR